LRSNQYSEDDFDFLQREGLASFAAETDFELNQVRLVSLLTFALKHWIVLSELLQC
jgi:hypothetical protein